VSYLQLLRVHERGEPPAVFALIAVRESEGLSWMRAPQFDAAFTMRWEQLPEGAEHLAMSMFDPLSGHLVVGTVRSGEVASWQLPGPVPDVAAVTR
jgi:hypothetical protein